MSWRSKSLLANRVTNFAHARWKIERLSAEAPFRTPAHNAKMYSLLVGFEVKMAAPKKVRRRTWEDRESRVLLEKWGDEKFQLRLKSCTRKKPIWQEIGDFLMACGYEDRDGEACKTRPQTLF